MTDQNTTLVNNLSNWTAYEAQMSSNPRVSISKFSREPPHSAFVTRTLYHFYSILHCYTHKHILVLCVKKWKGIEGEKSLGLETEALTSNLALSCINLGQTLTQRSGLLISCYLWFTYLLSLYLLISKMGRIFPASSTVLGPWSVVRMAVTSLRLSGHQMTITTSSLFSKTKKMDKSI